MSTTDKTEKFILKASKLHNYRFDYSKVVYVNCSTPVCITCPNHGDFMQVPTYHIQRKSGCPKCYRITQQYDSNAFVQLTTKKFVTNQFKYGQYTGFQHPIDVFCTTHQHLFTTTPLLHLKQDGGCKFCRIDKISISDDQWISRFNLIYNNQYDYSKITTKIYSNKKICVTCPIIGHGDFSPQAGAHAAGKHGCPTCAAMSYTGGYSEEFFNKRPEIKSNIGFLYLIKVIPVDNSIFLKIGITVMDIASRFKNKLPHSYELLHLEQNNLYNLHLIEQHVLTDLKSYQYIPIPRFPGWTECFDIRALPLILEAINQNNRSFVLPTF